MYASEIIIEFLKKHDRPLDEICVIRSTAQLKSTLANTKARIIITTIQKFTKILFGDEKQESKRAMEIDDDLDDDLDADDDSSVTGSEEVLKMLQKKERIAIIADEAHRSHGKQTTRRLHSFLGGNSKQASNITYFSFTSTPTTKVSEKTRFHFFVSDSLF